MHGLTSCFVLELKEKEQYDHKHTCRGQVCILRQDDLKVIVVFHLTSVFAGIESFLEKDGLAYLSILSQ